MPAPKNWVLSNTTVAAAFVGALAAFGVSAEAGPKLENPTGTSLQQRVAAAYAEGCPDLPHVSWWDTSHKKIVKYVDDRFDGDWDPYIHRWINYRIKMQRIFNADGTAVVKSRGVRLSGERLAHHIGDIDRRIRVTQCLKVKFGGKTAALNDGRKDGSATGGAGGDVIQTGRAKAQLASMVKGDPVQVSEISETELNIEIVAKCIKKTPVFQVTNLGSKWPRSGAIGIYRTVGKTKMTERRVRLANSQRMTFKAWQNGKPATGEVGLWLDPAWTRRGFAYDSRITCSAS